MKTQKRKRPGLPGRKIQPKQTRVQKLVSLEKRLELLPELVEEKLKGVIETIGTVWNNQKELSKSADRLDEQFCVLTRMSVKHINDVMVRIGSDDLIDETVIERYFKEWAAFRSRSDFRTFMLEWFLGKGLDTLPPPPKQETAPVPPDQKVEEPQEFGGDYNGAGEKSDGGDQTTVEVGRQDSNLIEAAAMSEGQDVNDPTPENRGHHDSTVS
jgi:hypothetical protein